MPLRIFDHYKVTMDVIIHQDYLELNSWTRTPQGIPDDYQNHKLAYSAILALPKFPKKKEIDFKLFLPKIKKTIGYWLEYSYEDDWYGGEYFIHGPFLVDELPDSNILATSFEVSKEFEKKLDVHLSDVNKEITEDLKRNKINLYDLPPRKFEEYIGSILQNQGFKVELTKSTRDGGYDIIALQDTPIGLDFRLMIECKRYRPDRKISVSLVRELWGILNDPLQRFDRGIIATTSSLSPDATKEIDSKFWKLSSWDNDKIMEYSGFKKDKSGLWLPNSVQ